MADWSKAGIASVATISSASVRPPACMDRRRSPSSVIGIGVCGGAGAGLVDLDEAATFGADVAAGSMNVHGILAPGAIRQEPGGRAARPGREERSAGGVYSFSLKERPVTASGASASLRMLPQVCL